MFRAKTMKNKVLRRKQPGMESVHRFANHRVVHHSVSCLCRPDVANGIFCYKWFWLIVVLRVLSEDISFIS